MHRSTPALSACPKVHAMDAQASDSVGRAGPEPEGLPPPAMSRDTWQAVASTAGLSPQQARIVLLVLRGRQDKEIAKELGLSYGTVRTYLDRIGKRLDAPGRVLLVVRIFEMAFRIQERECPRSR